MGHMLTREPDFGGNMIIFGPRVMIATDGLAATGLLQPGALISHSYRLRLVPGIVAPDFVDAMNARFPDAGWRIRDPSPPLSSRNSLTKSKVLWLRTSCARLNNHGTSCKGCEAKRSR